MNRTFYVVTVLILSLVWGTMAIAEPAWIDSTKIKGHAIGYSNMQDNSIASKHIRNGTIVRDDLSTVVLYSDVKQITATDTLLAAEVAGNTLFYARPLAAKADILLPSAVAGYQATFFVADADSLLITANASDSLIISTGAAYKTTSSVAGTVHLIALDSVRWLMTFTLGTWTSY